MPLTDQMLGQRLVVNTGGLQPKDHSLETIPLHVKTHLAQQIPKALGAVLNNHTLEDRLSIGVAKERVMLALAYVQADDQILASTPNPQGDFVPS